MKFRLLCLILALAMLLPVALTGCSGNNDSSEDLENIEQEASETTVSLRMYMITEDHVPTKEEVDAVKAERVRSPRSISRSRLRRTLTITSPPLSIR